MAIKVHMEALSPTMEEGQLVRWLKNEGDAVKEGDVLAEIETDKATMELVARGSGTLAQVSLKEGDTAPVGSVIAMIAGAGEELPSGGAAAGGSAGDAAAAGGEDASKDQDGSKREASTSMGQAVSREPGTGGSEASGRPESQEKLTPADEGTGVKKDDVAQPSSGGSGTGTGERGGAEGRRIKASPLARRLAEEAGVDLSQVEGTGPGGRITKRDIETAQESVPAAAPEAAPAAKGARPAAAAPVDTDAEEVPLSQMRKTIAKRLATSIGPIPTFYLTIECDVTRLLELRERMNSALEKEGIRASVNDFIIRAVAAALARHPEVNASWGDDAITRHHRVHIGVAVAVEDGLITPIVRDADRKRVRDIAAEVKELAGRAREKKLMPDEYTGATFSISNLGMFGIVEFTAIINPPEAGILAVGVVEEKVVVEGGEMVVRPRMRMTMSCDHRVIDGATGAKFLQTVRELIEDPLMIIA